MVWDHNYAHCVDNVQSSYWISTSVNYATVVSLLIWFSVININYLPSV